MGSLTFRQKLLGTFALLMILVMGSLGLITDWRMIGQSEESLETLKEQVIHQSTNSIAEWLATRLALTEAATQVLASTESVTQARSLLDSLKSAGDFLNVYVGTENGEMVLQSLEAEEGLPDGYDPRPRSWYQLAQSKGRPVVTKPYVDLSAGGIVLSTAVPLERGVFSGVVGADITLGTVNEVLEGITAADVGMAVLVDSDGTVLFHPDQAQIGQQIDDVLGLPVSFDERSRSVTLDGRDYMASFHPVGAKSVDWHLGLLTDTEVVMAPINAARWQGVLITILGVVISLVLVHLGLMILMRPLRKLDTAMADIASGEADLTQRLEVETRDEFGELAGSFNAFMSNVQSVVKEAQESTAELRTQVVSLKSTSQVSRSGAEQQLREIDMVAAAINEMSAAAGEIAQNALSTSEHAQQADSAAAESLGTVQASRDSSERLAREIGQASGVIELLGQDVSNITGVLEVIQGIAEQTNLLALNAAIEAARAGEAGRGFAVVADEVRNLAKRTQQSTGEINDMIERLEKGAERAVQVMQESRAVSNISMEKAQDAMDALHRIADGINSISNMTAQIATASEEQTSVVEELNNSVTRIADQGQDAAQAAADNDHLSAEIQRVGDALDEKVRRFRA